MNTSSDIIDSAKLETLFIATIQTLKINNKKCGNDEVCDLVSESSVNRLKENFLIKNLKYLSKTKKLNQASMLTGHVYLYLL